MQLFENRLNRFIFLSSVVLERDLNLIENQIKSRLLVQWALKTAMDDKDLL